MGLLDNVFKSLDDTLKAIEDGAIEKKLDEIGNSLERMTQKAPEVLDKVADTPAKVIEKFDANAETLKQTVQVARNEASKTIDIIQRQD